MVKPLTFKGDKKVKKRKRVRDEDDASGEPSTKALTTSNNTGDATDDDDSWVSAEAITDVSGPVLLVLQTSPPSCISCDPLGKVFPLQVENLVENNPSSAEPHDVRQVWIANRVAGTDFFSFKGHHGKYLGFDKFGIPSATSEAISPEESLQVVPVPDNPATFSLQTQRDKFVTFEESKDISSTPLRGDAEQIGFATTLRIRMQARYKPRLKLAKQEKAKEKISRLELEEAVGRRLDDDEVKKLKRARRDGSYHEALLDVKVKGKHDKFA